MRELYQEGNLDGVVLNNFIYENYTKLPSSEADAALKMVFTGTGGGMTDAERDIDGLNALLQMSKPKGEDATPERIRAFQDLSNDILDSARALRQRGITGTRLKEAIGSLRDGLVAKNLMDYLLTGKDPSEGGPFGIGNKETEAFKEWVYYSNQGNFDHFYNERLKPREGFVKLAVGGEKMAEYATKMNAAAKAELNKLLKDSGVTIKDTPAQMITDSSGDPKGAFMMEGSDENRYRLSIPGPDGSGKLSGKFFAERLVSGGMGAG
jgi:hypothetical protein